MRDTTRQKYMDAMSRRADLIAQADQAFSEGNVEKGKELTNSAAAINPEIEGYQALLAQEEQYAAASPVPQNQEATDLAEHRAETLRNGGSITFTAAEVQKALGIRNANTTLGTGSIVKPDRVGMTIHDGVGPVSSIIDMVYAQDLTGCQSILEPLLTEDMEAQGGKVTTQAGTARTTSDPTFKAAKIAPYEANVTSLVDRNLSRLTPVAYEEKIRSIAMRALRRKVAAMIYNGDGQGSNDMFGIKTAKDTDGGVLYKTVDVTTIAAGFLDAVVFGYGSDEEVGGNARLFLNKKDLAAIGALRTDDGKRIYEIVPDPANANVGRITDGGLIVPYVIGSALTSLADSVQTSSPIQTMVYGDPMNYELGLFGPYTIRIDESVKAIERMNAILGDCMVGGNLIMKDGFVVVNLPANG